MPQVPQPTGPLYLHGPYQARPGKYNLKQICSLLEASSHVSPRTAWVCLILIFQGIPFASPGSLLYFSQPQSTNDFIIDQPSTMIFFSGSFFPLATLSSMDDHKFFSWSPSFCGLSLLLITDALALVLGLRLMAQPVGENGSNWRIPWLNSDMFHYKE